MRSIATARLNIIHRITTIANLPYDSKYIYRYVLVLFYLSKYRFTCGNSTVRSSGVAVRVDDLSFFPSFFLSLFLSLKQMMPQSRRTTKLYNYLSGVQLLKSRLSNISCHFGGD